MAEGTDLVTIEPEETPANTGAELQPLEERHPEVAVQHSHPGPRQYVLIAIVLVILTAVEVATSYLEGHVNSNILIVALAAMAAVKFFLVASWYMHLRTDKPVFRRFFVIGSLAAVLLYALVLLMLHVSF